MDAKVFVRTCIDILLVGAAGFCYTTLSYARFIAESKMIPANKIPDCIILVCKYKQYCYDFFMFHRKYI